MRWPADGARMRQARGAGAEQRELSAEQARVAAQRAEWQRLLTGSPASSSSAKAAREATNGKATTEASRPRRAWRWSATALPQKSVRRAACLARPAHGCAVRSEQRRLNGGAARQRRQIRHRRKEMPQWVRQMVTSPPAGRRTPKATQHSPAACQPPPCLPRVAGGALRRGGGPSSSHLHRVKTGREHGRHLRSEATGRAEGQMGSQRAMSLACVTRRYDAPGQVFSYVLRTYASARARGARLVSWLQVPDRSPCCEAASLVNFRQSLLCCLLVRGVLPAMQPLPVAARTLNRVYTALYLVDVGGQAGNDQVFYLHPNGCACRASVGPSC